MTQREGFSNHGYIGNKQTTYPNRSLYTIRKEHFRGIAGLNYYYLNAYVYVTASPRPVFADGHCSKLG